MFEPSGDLLGANLEVCNSKGEVIFALKRKDKYPPTYYIFEKHEDRAANDEDKKKLNEAVAWISALSKRFGYTLYNMREINDAIAAQMKAVMETDEAKEAMKKVDESEELAFIKDISFKVFDYATGNINTLTVGVSMKDVSTDNEQANTETP